MMNRSPKLQCPHCGFAVFNRRYAKCERCNQDLPHGVAYSSEQIAGIRAREKAAALARNPAGRSVSSGDGDVGGREVPDGSGASSDHGCSLDGGSCGGGD